MAKRQTFRLLLVRSGATAWDEAERLQGDNDLPLSDAGKAETAAAIQAVDPEQLAVVLTSPDEASRQTAAMLAERTGARTRKLDALTEVDFGLWEGLVERELRDRYAKAFGAWEEDPTGVTPPDGETIAESAERVLPALRKALDKAGAEQVAVVLRPVAHAIVRCRVLGRPMTDLWPVLEEAPACEWLEADRDRFEPEPAPAQTKS
ncbi:MAG: histidine phosphatase family protein [Phycisphaerales bacterium]